MMDILTPILDDLESLYPKKASRGIFALNEKPEIKLYLQDLQDNGYLYRLEYLTSKSNPAYEMEKNIYNYLESYGLKLIFKEIIPTGPMSKKLLRFDITEIKESNESLVNKKSLEQLKKVKTKNISLKNFSNLLSDENILDKHIQTYEEFLKTKV